jgi:hypothetical protein
VVIEVIPAESGCKREKEDGDKQVFHRIADEIEEGQGMKKEFIDGSISAQ